MSRFLWIEDFENNVKTTAANVLSSLNIELTDNVQKQQLRKQLKAHGIELELSFQDGLDFIRNKEKLNAIDYIILDIDLVTHIEDDDISENFLEVLKNFHDYQMSAEQSEVDKRQSLKEKCKELKIKEIAGYYLYTELIVEQSFPKQHILFCSNHGDTTKEMRDAFKLAKINLPEIYQKSDLYVKKWVKEQYENPYSVLRQGVIEACKELKKPEKKLCLDKFCKEGKTAILDIDDYLMTLEKFLPLREPDDKTVLYKLFLRTLTHEWEATEPKKIRGLAWIMKNTRNWITHNSNLFNEVDENIVAYLFMINMRLMFDFDETVQNYEKILFSLFSEEIIGKEVFENQSKHKLLPIKDAYQNLQNKSSHENVKDALRFPALANNIQESESKLRSDKKLFYKILYQMFWLINAYPRIKIENREAKIKFEDFDYTKKPLYLREIARHIYKRSFS